MDEIEYKLKSRNAILVAEAVDMLLETIIKSVKVALNSEDSSPALDLLREKCMSPEPLVSATASEGFLRLLTGGYMETAAAMSLAMAMLPYTKNYSSITCIIAGMLVSSYEQKLLADLEYSSPWCLASPLHPFLMVLQQHPQAGQDVLAQVQAISQNKRMHCVELMRPVFVWLLCQPGQEGQGGPALRLLLTLDSCPGQLTLLVECLAWQQTSNYPGTYSFYTTVLEWSISSSQFHLLYSVLPLLACLMLDGLRSGQDPRPALSCLSRALQHRMPAVYAELMMMIMVQALEESPVTYLQDILNICDELRPICESYISVHMLAAALLHWLYFPTTLAEGFLNSARKTVHAILEMRPNHMTSLKHKYTNMESNKIFQFIQTTNRNIHTAMELVYSYDKFTADPKTFDQWIDSLKSCSNGNVKFELSLFLQGVLLVRSDLVLLDRRKVLEVLLTGVRCKKELACRVLPVVMNALTRTSDPEEVVDLLRAVPNLAVSKENIPIVLSILEDLQNKQALPASLLVDLYSVAVDNHSRCYPYLQKLLLDIRGSEGDWQVLTARAKAVKHICETRAVNHGAELVPLLSGFFNSCTSAASTGAFCLSLQALGALWRARIVSPPSTWSALAPRIARDKRTQVQIGLCELLSLAPSLRSSADPDYDPFIESTLTHLWRLSDGTYGPQVTTAALTALSAFPLTDLKLRQLPEALRKGVQLPSSFCKTPEDAAKRPEDVLDYIPSVCWGNLFRCTEEAALSGATALCHALMQREVSQYRSGVYAGSGAGEPPNLKHMQPGSVVAAVVHFVREQALGRTYDCSEAIVLESLECLSLPLPRPLPPLDWSFLHDLFHRGAHLRGPCLQLAARQAAISGSAKVFVQGYLDTIDLKRKPDLQMLEELRKILQILPILCQNLESAVLSPALASITGFAFSCSGEEDTGDEKLFVCVMKAVTEALKSEGIKEDCRNMLADFMEEYISKVDVEHEFWPAYEEACAELPLDHLERMTCPTSWWEVTGDMILKACCVRSRIARMHTHSSPLVWLNEVIDGTMASPREHIFVLHQLCSVLSQASGESTQTRDWFLRLISRTNVHMAETSSTALSVTFLCDVIILSAILFSGANCLTHNSLHALVMGRAHRLRLFSQAVNQLIRDWEGVQGELLEWFHHCRSCLSLPDAYRDAFYSAVVSGRHHSYFSKQDVWRKFQSLKPSNISSVN